ncbi:uncharacterized protein FTJAE_8979 [Fusarium tjaetaba]|uniref:Uncharacterized protein n=1 Tax=Fusarium tjaetaba TaxID=1567544 RepID=A0A8H5R7G1_9HYPO|nr:uncharacterized protein FTJAE_8979 [Fusarium tjaetaba]KAF5628104.1 hypothetical protein FTJAE_8979 [Fusarium tjaetaba]
MDLSVPPAYESYSNRLDPHDEVDDDLTVKSYHPVSDQHVLLRRRRARNKRRGAFDTVRLCLRILILLLDLSILSLLIHGVNVWDKSGNRNEDGWRAVNMFSTWLMLAIAVFASFVQIIAIATHLSLPQSLRDGWVHSVAVLASSGTVIAAWAIAAIYLIIDKEVLQSNSDLWSWSCQNRSRQSWATLCIEMSYTFIASLVVIVFEIVGLALYIISLRGVYIVGKYSRASTVY